MLRTIFFLHSTKYPEHEPVSSVMYSTGENLYRKSHRSKSTKSYPVKQRKVAIRKTADGFRTWTLDNNSRVDHEHDITVHHQTLKSCLPRGRRRNLPWTFFQVITALTLTWTWITMVTILTTSEWKAIFQQIALENQHPFGFDHLWWTTCSCKSIIIYGTK